MAPPARANEAAGALIVNADDWGRDRETTDRTLACLREGAVSSVSAMVFMEDSDRAAGLAKEHGVDAGLHLNLTAPFTASSAPSALAGHQNRVARYLLEHRFAQAVFHPLLQDAFRYSVAAQLAEFRRLYGHSPLRIDGHHHMHLASNVLLAGLLPAGAVVRRNFSFFSGEKGLANRWYRAAVDGMLARRHPMADYFFSLPPLAPPGRLKRIFALARVHRVEVETHPVQPDEYRFLVGGEIFRQIEGIGVARGYPVSALGVGG